MNYVGLSQHQLMRFSHHWFWGLCVDTENDGNLYDSALYLEQNQGLRQVMEADVEIMNKKTWLIRSLYWLFNYNQYRENYYQLQGYWSLQLYNKVESMFIQNLMANVGQFEGVSLLAFAVTVTVTGAIAINYLTSPVLQSLAWFSDKIFPFVEEQNIKILPETPDTHEVKTSVKSLPEALSPQQDETRTMTADAAAALSFVVRSGMLNHLRTLGINSSIGATVSLDALKTAYKAGCLRTHPDKTGTHNDAEFKLVGSAYNQLLDLIKQDSSSDRFSYQSASGFFGALSAMDRRLDELREAQELTHKDLFRQLEEVRTLAESQFEKEREQQQKIDDLSVRFARLFQLQDAALNAAQAAENAQQPSANSDSTVPSI